VKITREKAEIADAAFVNADFPPTFVGEEASGAAYAYLNV